MVLYGCDTLSLTFNGVLENGAEKNILTKKG
jgi:hypothetical protein